MNTKSIPIGWLKLVILVASTAAVSVNAFEIKFDNPNLSGFVDTTVTASVAITTTNGIQRFSPASGRLNVFENAGEVYSAPLSFITDAGIRWGNWGVFTRFGYLYDFEIMDGSNKCTNCGGNPLLDRTPAGALDGIPEGARNEYNAFTLYDLFIYGDLYIADYMASLRIGKQVVNWGESNIMGGGISSAINPEDLAKRTTPGTEVKERLLPQEMVYFNLGLTDNTSLEAYYIWNWRRTQFVPVGTYFSPFDFLGQGFNPDLSVPGVEKRGSDKPDRGGQWGVAIHHIFESGYAASFGVSWCPSDGKGCSTNSAENPGQAKKILAFSGIPEILSQIKFSLKRHTCLENFTTQRNRISILVFRKDFVVGRKQARNNTGAGGVKIGLEIRV